MKHALALFAFAVLMITESCGIPPPHGVVITPAGADTQELAQQISDDIAAWDRMTGIRATVPIHVEGDGLLAPGDRTFGLCVRLGTYREVQIDLDLINTRPNARAYLRQVIWHELTHAYLTCTDVDHVDDPVDLMSPYTTPQNLDATPSAAEISKMRALLQLPALAP